MSPEESESIIKRAMLKSKYLQVVNIGLMIKNTYSRYPTMEELEDAAVHDLKASTLVVECYRMAKMHDNDSDVAIEERLDNDGTILKTEDEIINLLRDRPAAVNEEIDEDLY